MSKKPIYLIYLKNDKSLYAHTTSKQMKELFLSQRNPNCFITKTINLGKNSLYMFSKYHRDSLLTLSPINISKFKDIDIVATHSELTTLYEECDKLDRTMYECKTILTSAITDSKYLESVEYLTKILYYKKNDNGTKDAISTINLLSLFNHLFKNTFYDEELYNNE